MVSTSMELVKNHIEIDGGSQYNNEVDDTIIVSSNIVIMNDKLELHWEIYLIVYHESRGPFDETELLGENENKY